MITFFYSKTSLQLRSTGLLTSVHSREATSFWKIKLFEEVVSKENHQCFENFSNLNQSETVVGLKTMSSVLSSTFCLGITIVVAILSFVRIFIGKSFCLNAARVLHDK